MENNFVYFYFHTKLITLYLDWMNLHNRNTGRLGFDILIDTGTFNLIYLSYYVSIWFSDTTPPPM